MRFGIIGTNFITDWFLQAALPLPQFTLTAVYSRTRERGEAFAAKYGAPQVFTSTAQLAACSEVDAVYIASPNALHHPQAMEMLRAKKHVLCEKPIATNRAQLEELLACAQQNGVVLMEAMRTVHSPGPAAIRALLPQLGDIRRVSLVFNQYSSRYDKFKAGVVENAFNPALSNGALMDIGVYCVQLLISLFGPPQSVCAKAIVLPGSIDAQGCILAGYEGFLAEVSYSKISDAVLPSTIQGEQGALLLPHITRGKALTLIPRGGEPQEHPFMAEENDMVHEIEHFIAYAQGENPADLANYQQISLDSMALMDEVRYQQGVVFPADVPGA